MVEGGELKNEQVDFRSAKEILSKQLDDLEPLLREKNPDSADDKIRGLRDKIGNLSSADQTGRIQSELVELESAVTGIVTESAAGANPFTKEYFDKAEIEAGVYGAEQKIRQGSDPAAALDALPAGIRKATWESIDEATRAHVLGEISAAQRAELDRVLESRGNADAATTLENVKERLRANLRERTTIPALMAEEIERDIDSVKEGERHQWLIHKIDIQSARGTEGPSQATPDQKQNVSKTPGEQRKELFAKFAEPEITAVTKDEEYFEIRKRIRAARTPHQFEALETEYRALVARARDETAVSKPANDVSGKNRKEISPDEVHTEIARLEALAKERGIKTNGPAFTKEPALEPTPKNKGRSGKPPARRTEEEGPVRQRFIIENGVEKKEDFDKALGGYPSDIAARLGISSEEINNIREYQGMGAVRQFLLEKQVTAAAKKLQLERSKKDINSHEVIKTPSIETAVEKGIEDDAVRFSTLVRQLGNGFRSHTTQPPPLPPSADGDIEDQIAHVRSHLKARRDAETEAQFKNVKERVARGEVPPKYPQ